MKASSRTFVVAALAVLLLGVLVYLLDRSPESSLLTEVLGLSFSIPITFGLVGQSLPTFVHAFAFCLLTAALLAGGTRTAVLVCLSWFLLEIAFEVGQHPTVATALSAWMPDWFSRVPILANSRAYFQRGTFDPIDLLSIALGVIAAYWVILKFSPKGDKP